MLPVIASSSSRHPDFTRSRQRARLSLASDSAFFLVDFLAKLVTLDRDASGALLPEWRKDWPVKSRTLLRSIGHLKYELLPPYTTFADSLCQWIPDRRSHIEERLGVLPLLSSPTTRVAYAEERQQVLDLLRQQIGKTPAKFEIISFAVIKVHLEKFACKVYRDTRTASGYRTAMSSWSSTISILQILGPRWIPGSIKRTGI